MNDLAKFAYEFIEPWQVKFIFFTLAVWIAARWHHGMTAGGAE